MQYPIDAWNRLVEIRRVAEGDETTVGAYEYDGLGREIVAALTNTGEPEKPRDGGRTCQPLVLGTGLARGSGDSASRQRGDAEPLEATIDSQRCD